MTTRVEHAVECLACFAAPERGSGILTVWPSIEEAIARVVESTELSEEEVRAAVVVGAETGRFHVESVWGFVDAGSLAPVDPLRRVLDLAKDFADKAAVWTRMGDRLRAGWGPVDARLDP